MREEVAADGPAAYGRLALSAGSYFELSLWSSRNTH